MYFHIFKPCNITCINNIIKNQKNHHIIERLKSLIKKNSKGFCINLKSL